ncbi:uncharacterized protein VSU04_004587 isoform 1-T1 [Chlamydotis macqueenii]
MDFYATSVAAHGQPRSCPRLGYRTGYVSNNHLTVPDLLCLRGAAEGQSQDTATSTTAEDFVPPESRSLLPRRVQQPGSGSRSCLAAGVAGPQHMRRLRGTNSAQPGVLQKTTFGIKEQSGFAWAAPKTDSVLPALPLGAGVASTNYLPSARSHVGGTLPAGSGRGNRFDREVPGCRGVTVSGTPSPSPASPPPRPHSLSPRSACPWWATPSHSSPGGCRRPEGPHRVPAGRSRRGSITASMSPPAQRCPPPRQPGVGGVRPQRPNSGPNAPAASAPPS